MPQALLAFALGAVALSNFPRDTGGRIARTAIAVQVGGAPAVVVAAGDRLTAFRADGTTVPGFPAQLDDVAAGPPAAGDMDGDGRPEIAVVSVTGRLYLWSGGAPVPGFPVRLGPGARAGPSFADVDGDGRPEVLAGDKGGRVHALRRNRAEVKGWPARVGCPVSTSVSSSDFAGSRSFAFGCEDGRVQVLDAKGKQRKGFPLRTAFTVSGAPAFADLDDDGAIDLVATSQDFKVYAVSAEGNPLSGFPVAADYRIYEGPALGDLDGDGRLDVVFASADGFLHAVSREGRPLAGFPVQAGIRIFGGAALADLDRDGRLDVAVVGADGTVYAFDGRGRPLAGFPEPLAANETTASPLLLDLAHQGAPAVFVGLASGRLHALRVQRVSAAASGSGQAPSTDPGEAPPPGPGQARAPAGAPPAAWPQAGRDAAQSGRYGPNPPGYMNLVLAPEKPRVTEGLKASWKAVWLDAKAGDKPPPPRVGWQRNGKDVPALEGKAALPPGTARKGERWRFVLTGPTGKTFESQEVTVVDSPPGEATVAIDPPTPSRARSVKAVITAPAPDPDGDTPSYRIQWLLDGVDTGVSGDTFPGEKAVKGALLGARVVASDGELDGPPALGVARVLNTPPGALEAVLEPEAPGRAEPVRARVARPAEDLDGDQLVYRHVWKVGGEVQNLPEGTSELPAGSFRKHQVVEVEVRAFDGEEEGPPAVARVTARNTAPTAPAVAIWPAAPRKGEALRAVLTAAADDVDADVLSYRYAWRKNGQPVTVSGDGREIPGTQVARGDRFEVSVLALDGEAEGPSASAQVTVGNTPPEPPRIAVEPARPRGGDTLSLKILEAARDVDGDPVKLTITWTREGRPTGSGEATLAPAGFRKNERVRVTVAPSDGTDAGAPATFEVKVENAPPGPLALSLSPEKPSVSGPLRAVLASPATDADGDTLRYRYRWMRDGTPVAFPDGSDGSQRPPYWTTVAEIPAKELRKGQRWAVEAQAGDGDAFGPAARADTTVINSPPPAPTVTLRPDAARRVDGLVAEVRQGADADGDPVTHRYTWTRDGQKVDVAPDQSQIARGTPRRGQRWAVEVVATDGEGDSPPARAEVVVADSAPGPVVISLCEGAVPPGLVPSGTVPEVRIGRPSTDPDGDPVSYRYEWTVNGRAVAGASGKTRFGAPLRKHDVVRVAVTPFDGELSGPTSGAECTVRNTPATPPAVALEPAEPGATSGVTVSVRRPSTDLDGDPVSYRYAWTRNGVPALFDGANVPSDTLRHGEVWRVEVKSWDGEEEGEPVALTVTVKNTAPPTPSVLLTPASAAVGEPVTCDARAPAKDADQEPITLRYQWFKDDKAQAVAEGSPALPRGVVRRGERWRCEAWASDGQGGESPRGKAELLVRNSPPRAPQVAIEPEKPRRSGDMLCRIAVASVDPDGDPVSYAYAWTRNGKAQPPAADPARVPAKALRKGERWRCQATPSDGTARGADGSAEIVVANTPPGPARVRVIPDPPRPAQALRCDVVVPGEDIDGDVVRYRFRWQRNGALQPFAETSQEVPSRLVRAGDRWRCTAISTDRTDLGPEGGSEEVTVSPGPGRSP
jgi:hypothetical protein